MSKQAYTPAPWRFEYGEIRGAEAVQVNGWPKPVGLITNASYSDRVCGDLGNPELPGPAANIRLIAAAPDLLAMLKTLIDEVDGLMSESLGVYGMHLNGDPSPWSELEPGGRFERLSSLDEARALVAKVEGQ